MRDKESNQAFIEKHRLPDAYLTTAQRYFDPVAEALGSLAAPKNSQGLLIALSGSQGSGKSTLTDYLHYFLSSMGLTVLSISLDDFYLSKADRLARAEKVHPLFETRGVPGTHDTAKLYEVLSKFKQGELKGALIPRFDKAKDDLYPAESWTCVEQNPDILILEGWCLGVETVKDAELDEPCNQFEREKDSDGRWRKLVNLYIHEEYERIQTLCDFWLFLQAPSFDSVYEWRLEQEEKMRAKMHSLKGCYKGSNGNGSGLNVERSNEAGMTPEEVYEFVQYYQRLTERILKRLADKADVVWKLDNDRKIVTMRVKGLLAEHGLDTGRAD